MLLRQGCHLCVEALAVIESVCAERGVTWSAIDIDADPDLRSEYTDHVPVTFVDGDLHARWFVDEARLRDRLDRAR